MALAYYQALHGSFVIVGKSPDGDSVRFIADNPAGYQSIYRAYRIEPARDGSVQLRFEGIDAPEVHYGKAAQPLGNAVRDSLLARLGFTNVVINPNETVLSATPDRISGWILTKGVDANGRPIAYVLPDTATLTDGEATLVDEALLKQTINHELTVRGLVYYTVYTSTPALHRHVLRAAAAEARANLLGVWAVDCTSRYRLESQADLEPGEQGQLILPKLFRRSTDFLKKPDGAENLKDWLLSKATGSRPEDDLVLICGHIEVPLSQLVVQQNQYVLFQADTLDIVFVEK
ncbi:hypothetical protein FAES_3462 [Fibrella aestuarina BUZ 2]|uniref:TNase-like domain-containing protein n=1 Tax=Fibrella aestuarina BUZ 2 TaxID=1166018 RepID=I0KBG6_9BACT|nr:thermonuclease family protein [Fibrella aestuarina]CCH01469.1 hypothetical protein FAES_3462 [Fibrella aestuarina BUZ 2]